MSKISSGSLTIVDRSKERATQQHFWFNAVTDTLESGAYITNVPIDTFKNGKSGGYALIRSDGLILGNGVNRYMELSGSALKFYKAGTTDPAQGSSIPSTSIAAELNSTGLEIASGGIKAGDYSSTATDANQDFVYLSSQNYGTGVQIGNSSSDKSDWRQIIGNKFGVDKAGNLYAAGANIEGAITATSLTISSGGTTYSGVSAINASGYSIEITMGASTDENVYLYPHLYLNGEAVSTTEIVYTHFLWYKDNDTEHPTPGNESDGGILGIYGHTYRVTYELSDASVGETSVIQTRTVDPQKYITQISDTGITIHPEVWNNQSSYIQLDGTGMKLFDSNNDIIAKYGNIIQIGSTSGKNVYIDTNGVQIRNGLISLANFGATAQIGQDNSSRFLMNNNSLQAYDTNNNMYFEVTANGLSWGNNTAATENQVNVINNYISTHLNVDSNGLWLTPDNSGSKVLITAGQNDLYQSAGTYIIKNNTLLSSFAENGIQLGLEDESHLIMNYRSMQMKNKESNTYFYISDLRDKEDSWQATLTEFFEGDGETVDFDIHFIVSAEISAIDSEDNSNTATRTDQTYTFLRAPALGSVIKITYKTLDIVQAYTLGYRKENTTIGGYSVAEGFYTTASGVRSHAEGNTTSAMGYSSHAEGLDTVASGNHSHAEGNYAIASGSGAHAEGSRTKALRLAAHAEGNFTIASGIGAHAEGGSTEASNSHAHAGGYYTVASGTRSFASNNRTIAQRQDQTAIGQLNIADTDGVDVNSYGKYVFIIGNGHSEDSRSNALTVSWTGNLSIAGTLTQSSDRRLKDHQSYLSTDAINFIHNLKPAYFKKDEQPHVGFYAQDVESIDPWNCMIGEMNGFKTLGYTEIIAPLVAYCQHLEERIKQLEES